MIVQKSIVWKLKICSVQIPKSIMGIMAIGATKGTRLTLKVDGEDAEATLTALVELFESNFNED